MAHPGARPMRRGGGMHAGGRPLPPRGNRFYHRGHAFNRIHATPFVYPHGWHYRRWGIGGILPGLFWSPTYYYNSWAALGLQAPAPGYEWVRFGPDLLLVNIATGGIEDVVYGVFL
jgi:hypothetical protein